jgi:ACR3 family arsenite efflux pump ArsB
MIAAACLMLLSVVFSESLCMPTVVGSLLLQLGIPLLILAQVHWVAQELYLHRP